MNTPKVKLVSRCYIKPQYITEKSKEPYHLTPWDLALLSVNYIQKGLIFMKPPSANTQERFISTLLDRLKHSLSHALVHFYPLAGRLATQQSENPHSYIVFIDCNNSPGAKFIHAELGMTVSDILSPTDVPPVVQLFFDHDRAVNHDGHNMSLLSIQVTDLVDGIFIGCSMNHAVGDGTSYWNFINAWSEIFQAKEEELPAPISRPPILKRWFPDGSGLMVNLPYKHKDEFISRFEAPILRERIFHFSAESIKKLKAKANAECNTNKISSFQSLSAFMWRSITRARGLKDIQKTTCKLSANNRTRMNPPLPQDYFGNSIYAVMADTTAGDLLQNSFGWAARKVHLAVSSFTDKMIQEWLQDWLRSPSVISLGRFVDPHTVIMGSSPRFNMYGNEFGMGKALAVRSGYGNKFDGKVTSYPGHEGGGSIDLEVCLLPPFMSALECDQEFMDAVSPYNPLP